MKDRKLFIISLVIAVLCYFLIKIKSEEDHKQAIGPMQLIIVAETNIPKGTELSREHIEPKNIPLKYYSPNTLLAEDWSRIIGLKLTRDLKKGDQISYTDLPLIGQHLADDIPSGMRSYTITVNANSSQAGQTQPGDFVDIIGIFMNDKEMSSKTLLQNIQVIAVGGQRLDHEISSHYGNVSLLLTPLQCQHLALAQRLGEITLVLRSPQDKGRVTNRSSHENDLGKATIVVPRDDN